MASEHGKQGLHRMARETGGAYYEVTESHSIEEIYSQIEEALRNQYSIGYTPGRTHPEWQIPQDQTNYKRSQSRGQHEGRILRQLSNFKLAAIADNSCAIHQFLEIHLEIGMRDLLTRGAE
jgi:hypothetical protein